MSDLATEAGRVAWYTSEIDGGPDVGISVGLGSGKVLWLGERSDAEGGGDAMMVYDNGNLLASAAIGDRDELIDLLQYHLAPAITSAPSA